MQIICTYLTVFIFYVMGIGRQISGVNRLLQNRYLNLFEDSGSADGDGAVLLSGFPAPVMLRLSSTESLLRQDILIQSQQSVHN